jgi:hypothetical protein
MDKKKPNTASNSFSGAKVKQMPAVTKGKMATKQTSSAASASSYKTTTTTKKHSSEDSSSIPFYTLFWLDSNINMKDDDCHRTITQLRSVISTLHVFDDSNECENFLHTIANQKVFMVASGSLGQYILGRIHHLPQLTAVFIYCSDRSKYESLPKSWPKVQGIFTDMTTLCESLKRATRQCDEELTDISLVPTSDISGQRLDQLDQSFMYTQLIKEILLKLEYSDKNLDEFAAYCRDKYVNQAKQLKQIKSFQDGCVAGEFRS